MPGIPLLNLGYGLGGLSQGFNQARSQGLQQALQQLALQQAQSQQNAQSLAGLALQAGLLNNPVQTNPLSPINNSPAGPQASGAPAVPQPPTQTAAPPDTSQYTWSPEQGRWIFKGDQSASTSAPQMGPGTYYGSNINLVDTVGTGTGNEATVPSAPYISDPVKVEALPPPAAAPSSPAPSASSAPLPAPAPKDYDIDNTKNFKVPDRLNDDSSAPGVTPPGGYGQGTGAGPSPTSTAPTQTASAGASDSGGGGGGSSAPSSSGATSGGNVAIQYGNSPPIDISTMFQRMDYGKLAQGIARIAPPGTSQADIYAAVVDLSKLAEGDKVQQQQAGALLREITGIQGKLIYQDRSIAAAGDRQQAGFANQQNLQNQRFAHSDQQADLNRQTRQNQFDQRLKQTENIQNVSQRNAQLRMLLGDIDRQLNPGGLNPPPSDEDRAQLMQQRTEILNEIRKLSRMKQLPATQAQPSQ